jgi:transposase-like protein
MQRGPDAAPLELISISEAARKIGVNESTLSRQIESGAVRSHDGKVVL